jgi:hypothetical protein
MQGYISVWLPPMTDGEILAYCNTTQAGVIQTPCGAYHYFTKARWLSPQIAPAAGMKVTFEARKRHAHRVEPARSLRDNPESSDIYRQLCGFATFRMITSKF